MENLDTIKFKKGESPNIFYKIDLATGDKISFSSNSKPKTSGFGMNKEMQEWISDGNTIEPQYTLEEQDQKEAKEVLEAEQQVISEAKAWLAENDFKYMQNIRRKARGTITPEQETEFQDFLNEADQKAQDVPAS